MLDLSRYLKPQKFIPILVMVFIVSACCSAAGYNGSLFFFSSAYDKNGSFVRLDLGSMSIRPLGFKGDDLAVSPDGRILVYLGSRSIFHAHDLATGKDIEFGQERADYSEPVFISKHLFGFLKYRNDTLQMSLCIKSALDGKERQLPHAIPDKVSISADIAYVPPLSSDLPFVVASGPNIYVLTEKSAKLLYTSSQGDNLRYPSVSPDGRKIAFVSDLNEGLWIMNVDGSGLKRLTATDCQYTSWSPDGKYIAFTSVNSASRGTLYKDVDSGQTSRGTGFFTHRIWVIGADGSNPRPLAGPDGKGVGIMGRLVWTE